MRSLFPLSVDWKQLLPFRSPDPAEARDVWRMADGTAVTLRASRPDDAGRIQHMVRGLSVSSRYQRFFSPIHELAPAMLDLFTRNAPAQAITLLAVVRRNGTETVVAMAQYVADPYPQRCDFGVVVAEEWRRGGLGRKLIESLVCIARAAGFERMEGDVLAENMAIQRLIMDMGFHIRSHPDGVTLSRVTKRLVVPQWKCTPLTALAH